MDESVIIELKAASKLMEEHENQLMHYLKASSVEAGLLLNFGIRPAHVRKVYDNELKVFPIKYAKVPEK